jgi:Na+-translocating ferredoxin:NAD+ oxidoreductase RnfA subunit
MNLIAIIVSGLFGGNLLLTKFLDLTLLQSVKKLDVAVIILIGMLDVTLISGLVFYPLYTYVLLPFELGYLSFVVIVVLIALVTEVEEAIVKRFFKTYYENYSFYFPLISINVVITYLALLITVSDVDFWSYIVSLIVYPLGMVGIMIMMIIYQERFDKLNRTPLPFKGIGLTLITLALIAMALIGFGGL